jgi:Zn-dependent protease with chaperone function
VDFFSRQEQSRRTTRRLVVLFALAFLTVALATTLIAAAALSLYLEYDPFTFGARSSQQWAADNAWRLAAFVAAIVGVMLLASLYRTATLSRGGGQVARMLGATEIRGDDPDPLRQRLINVVEEMAIASGLPVPQIFVLEQEPGINAFAAGLTHRDAAVAVTRGTLERLNRAELQGVVAHEFSHILNGDMRLNLRLIGFSFGILVLWLVGRWLLRSSRFAVRARNRGTSAALFIGFGLAAIGGIGVLLSRVIKAAVARQRERLADASAVQFTRDPSGLAGALKKIGGFTAHLSSVETEEVAHMLFGRGAPSFRGLFATHPPLIERIRALEPSFGGNYQASGHALPSAPEDARGALAALAEGPAPADLESTGRIDAPEVGAALRAAIPEELHHAAHSRESSFLLVLALALSDDETARGRQAPLLERRLGGERARRCLRLRTELADLDRRLWLPLLELAAPALRQRPDEQLEFLFELVEKLAAVDEQLDVFEYALLRMLATYFPGRARPSLLAAPREPRLGTDEALCTLLATAAAFGHADAASARAACTAGLAAIGKSDAPGAERTIDACLADRTLKRLDAALVVLVSLPERSRRLVLTALLAVIRHDSQIESAEIELFRTIAAVLGCPMPPTATIR